MRNETPAWRVYAEVFGVDDPTTLHARKFRRNLWQLDHLLRSLYWQKGVADAFRTRGKSLPNFGFVHPDVQQTMCSWAIANFPLDAGSSLALMAGEPTSDICDALEMLPVLYGAGLTAGKVWELVEAGFSVPELARALEASGGVLEYAMALVSPTVARVPPF